MKCVNKVMDEIISDDGIGSSDSDDGKLYNYKTNLLSCILISADMDFFT